MSAVFFVALVDPRDLPLCFGPTIYHSLSRGGLVPALAWAGAGASVWV